MADAVAKSRGPQDPRDRFRAGVDELLARRFLRARRLLSEAVKAGGSDAVWACQELIQTFLRRGEGTAAEAHLRALLPDGPLLRHGLGYLQRRLGRLAEAEGLLEQARLLRPRLWAVNNELGILLSLTGRHNRGDELLRAAEAAFRRADDGWGLATTLSLRATAAVVRFRLGDAERLLALARIEKEGCGDRFGLAALWSNGGLVHYYADRFHDAIEACRIAAQLYRDFGELWSQAHAVNNIGQCHLDLGEPALAEAAFRDSVRLLRRHGNPVDRATAEANLALALVKQDRLAQAEDRFRAALRVLTPELAADHHATAVVNLTDALLSGGKLGAARRLLASLETGDGLDLRSDLMLARARLAVGIASGDPATAIADGERAMRAVGRLPTAQRGLVAELAPLQVQLGRAYLATADRARGSRILKAAVRGVDALLERQVTPAIRIGLLAANRAAHDALIHSLLARSDGRAAWDVAAELKARELRRTLFGDDRGRDRSSQRADHLAELRQLAAKPRLTRREQVRLKLLDGLTHDPSPNIDGDPRRARAGGRPRLPPTTLLLEFHVSSATTIAFVQRGRRTAVIDLELPSRLLTRRTERLLAPLQRVDGIDARRRLLDFDLDLAHHLYRSLLEPALTAAGGPVDELLVIPDGPLHALPLELLVTDPGGGSSVVRRFADARFVGDRYRARYVQARRLLRAPEADVAPPQGALLVGYSPRAGTTIARRGEPVVLAPLPGARTEIDRVRAAFPGARVRLGADARAAALAGPRRPLRLLHVAAHGLFDARAGQAAAIVLAPDRRGAGPRLVTSDEIARMRLPTELVTLSACDSARGPLRGPEGVLGLVRAFIAAGAEAVLASLWPVDDSTTADFMRAFYAAWQAGESRAAALASAKLAIRGGRGTDPRRAHPFYWAPFVLIDRSLVTGSSRAAAPRTGTGRRAAGPPRST